MIPWPARLAAYFGFLVSAVLLTLLQPLGLSGDGYITSGVTLSVILMLYSLLLMNSKRFSEMWASIVGPGTGTMGDSSSVFNTDSLLSRFSVILEENGLSWLRASDRLKELESQLELMMQWLIQDEAWRYGEENEPVERRLSIDEKEEEEASE